MFHVQFRRAVLTLYAFCCSLQKTAGIMNVSISSISRWTRRLEPLKRAPRVIHDPDMLAGAIKAILAVKKCSNCREIAATLKESAGVSISHQLDNHQEALGGGRTNAHDVGASTAARMAPTSAGGRSRAF